MAVCLGLPKLGVGRDGVGVVVLDLGVQKRPMDVLQKAPLSLEPAGKVLNVGQKKKRKRNHTGGGGSCKSHGTVYGIARVWYNLFDKLEFV